MYRFIPLAHKSKRFPNVATTYLIIDTGSWKIGFAHYGDMLRNTIDSEIQFLCFSLKWFKYIEDI